MIRFSENVSVLSLETGKTYHVPTKQHGDDAFLDPHTRSWRSKTPIPEIQAVMSRCRQESSTSKQEPNPNQNVPMCIHKDKGSLVENETTLLASKSKTKFNRRESTPIIKVLACGLVVFLVFILVIMSIF